MKYPNKQKGVAAVEFGLLLVPLVTLAFGITEFGRAMYQYNTIAKGARDAVRFVSVKSPAATDDAIAKCLVAYGNTGCKGTQLISGFVETAKVVVKNSPLQTIPGGELANLVTVEVTGFKFVSLVSFVVPDITFGPIAATMFGPPPP